MKNSYYYFDSIFRHRMLASRGSVVICIDNRGFAIATTNIIKK